MSEQADLVYLLALILSKEIYTFAHFLCTFSTLGIGSNYLHNFII